MKPQLFHFKPDQTIRTVRDEHGNPWFVGKDACDILGYKQAGPAIKKHCRPKGVMNCNILTDGGQQRMTLINEGNLYRLAANSKLPSAEQFEEWIFDEVLPSIRKNGTYSLKNMILPQPCQWEKTFPKEFMRQTLKLYGYDYDPKKNTPQFVGKFILKYVYGGLDKEAAAELKRAQQQSHAKDETAFLHQFLNSDGRSVLKDHLISLITLMKGSGDIEHFDKQFNRVFGQHNQLELRFRWINSHQYTPAPISVSTWPTVTPSMAKTLRK